MNGNQNDHQLNEIPWAEEVTEWVDLNIERLRWPASLYFDDVDLWLEDNAATVEAILKEPEETLADRFLGLLNTFKGVVSDTEETIHSWTSGEAWELSFIAEDDFKQAREVVDEGALNLGDRMINTLIDMGFLVDTGIDETYQDLDKAKGRALTWLDTFREETEAMLDDPVMYVADKIADSLADFAFNIWDKLAEAL